MNSSSQTISVLSMKMKTSSSHIKELNSACSKYDMKISAEKVETMIIRREPINRNITIKNAELNQVDHLKCLIVEKT